MLDTILRNTAALPIILRPAYDGVRLDLVRTVGEGGIVTVHISTCRAIEEG